MILAFSGDPFLVRRGARQALRERGFASGDVTELGEGMEADRIDRLARQSGLFGATALFLDFDAAFRGQSGVKPRNAALTALETVPEDTVVIVADAGATPARQKRWRALGTLVHSPTPRYGALPAWIASEMKDQGLIATRGVPALLADLFGEDLPALASEIHKLSVLGERLDEDRVRSLVNRPASRDACDMIDAVTAGDEAAAVAVARTLLAAGEAPQRILGALGWQFSLVAKAVALHEEQGEVPRAVAAKALGVAPFPAGKATAIAARLREPALSEMFRVLLETEVATKTGRRDPEWALTSAALALASTFARSRAA